MATVPADLAALPDDELLGSRRIADLLGIARMTWGGWVSRGHAPKPDGRERVSGYPCWKASTIRAWQQDRPGQGRRRSAPVG